MSIIFLLVILLLITTKSIFIGFLSLILMFLLPIRKWEKILLFFLFVIFLLRIFLDVNFLNFYWIKVSDNLCANLISRAFCKIDNLSIGDIFEAKYYLNETFDNIDGLIGIIKFSDIKIIGHSFFHENLFNILSHLPIIAKQVYYFNFEKASYYLRFILSSGIFISGGFYVLNILINKKFNQKICNIIDFILLINLIIIFGYRFILLRKIIAKICQKYHFSSFLEIIIILFIFPTAINQLAFIYPYLMKTITFIAHDNKFIKFKRMIVSLLLQSYYLMSVNIVTLFGYNIFKIISGIYFWAAWFGFKFDIFNDAYLTFNLKGQLSIYIIILIVLILVISNLSIKSFLLIKILLILGYSLIYFYPYHRIIFIDVGQGDSQLFISPFLNEVILLDTGKENAYRKLKLTLDRYGIYKINQLITTHNDNDHNGNVFNLFKDFHIDYYASNKDEVIIPKQFDFKYLLLNKKYDNDNDNSIIIYSTINNFKLLFLGDASKVVERDIIKWHQIQNIDVIKLGHHGSKTSSDSIFLDQICNKNCFGIISSNPKIYGHPHLKTKQTLLNLGIMILETYNDKNIILEFRNKQLHIFTTRYKFIIEK